MTTAVLSTAKLPEEDAVVVTFTLKATALPATIRWLGVTEHELFVGAPVQFRETVPVNPATGTSWRL